MRPTGKSIFLFWLPLAATWVMMAVEGPFLAAVIARLADPTFNLAAHGVAVAFAILVEAPVIMIMSASTALVEDPTSYRKLRNFTYTLNAAISAAMVVVLVPPVFRLIMEGLIGLPVEVARLTHGALVLLLPWPAAIGYRRFFQGLLIRANRTRLVAYGTVLRLVTMASTGLILYGLFALPGAYVGGAALSAGVCAEAAASRLMARGTVRRLLASPAALSGEATLGYHAIARFYYPLALTSFLGLAVQPMLTFFMGQARHPVESLAVFPVVHALSFLFRAFGLSYQEVAIALLGRNQEHVNELGRFALGLGLASFAGLVIIAFTPLALLWFETVSGLSPDLSRFATTPIRILAPIPALAVLLSFQRAILVNGHETRPITAATAIEVVGIGIGFAVLGYRLNMVGVTAAAIAFVIGRAAANAYLVVPCLRVVERSRQRSLAPASERVVAVGTTRPSV